MRVRAVIAGLALLSAGVVGCTKTCYMTIDDRNKVNDHLLPANVYTDPSFSSNAPGEPSNTPAPATVDNPEQPIRHLSLAESIAMALEDGRGFGGPASTNPGANPYNDSFVSSTGRGLTQTDSIRVLALDPANTATNLEVSLSKFDAQFLTSMSWNTTDQPVGTAQDRFLTSGTLNNIARNDANFQSILVKPLPTGGYAGITFTNAYEQTNLPARINPSYRPSIQFGFEQPLLQAFGGEINQLRGSLLGSSLFSNVQRYVREGGDPSSALGTGSEGILISRVRMDQSRAEFERQVQLLVFKVEIAYWNLYAAYGALYSAEEGLRDAYDAWRVFKVKNNVGTIAIQSLVQARGQFELFRGRRLQALGQVLERERQLRGLVGLPVADGFRLVPADAPTLAPFQPDWTTGLSEALALRPELILAREDLKVRQLQLSAQKNQLLPDLRLTATYDDNAIGSRMDGSSDTNALHNLWDNRFNNWTVGLQYSSVLGYRAAHAGIRQFNILVAQSYFVLRDQEKKIESELAVPYRNIVENYQLIQASIMERKSYAEQREALKKLIEAGKGTPEILLEAQRFLVDARQREYQNIAQYNIELANWEYSKGTIMQHDSITIGEGALPECAQARAVEHLRERTKALVLHERALPVKTEATIPEKTPAAEDMDETMPGKAPAMPALFREDKLPPPPTPLPTLTREERAEWLGRAKLPASGTGTPNTSVVPATLEKPAANSGTIIFPEIRRLPADSSSSDSLPGTPGTIVIPQAKRLLPIPAPNAESLGGSPGTIIIPESKKSPEPAPALDTANGSPGTVIFPK